MMHNLFMNSVILAASTASTALQKGEFIAKAAILLTTSMVVNLAR